jgi:hypothetical protein
MLSRRSLLFGGVGLAALASHSSPANASLFRAMTLAELLRESEHAFVGTSLDAVGAWESIGGRDRIVTRTRVRVESVLDGRPPPATELTVRTLGGKAGNIGQIVFGEAQLGLNVTAAMFVESLPGGIFAVTGMAQGHYPLQADEHGVRRVRVAAKELEHVDTTSAVARLSGRTVTEVGAMLVAEMARRAR